MEGPTGVLPRRYPYPGNWPILWVCDRCGTLLVQSPKAGVRGILDHRGHGTASQPMIALHAKARKITSLGMTLAEAEAILAPTLERLQIALSEAEEGAGPDAYPTDPREAFEQARARLLRVARFLKGEDCAPEAGDAT
jgi:hypothetical protein